MSEKTTPAPKPAAEQELIEEVTHCQRQMERCATADYAAWKARRDEAGAALLALRSQTR